MKVRDYMKRVVSKGTLTNSKALRELDVEEEEDGNSTSTEDCGFLNASVSFNKEAKKNCTGQKDEGADKSSTEVPALRTTMEIDRNAAKGEAKEMREPDEN